MPPETHPLPPDDLAERDLPLVQRHGPWVRLHQGRYDPVYFGRTGRNRFDAPWSRERDQGSTESDRGASERDQSAREGDRSFGVLYVAEDAFAAFIECFGRPTGTRVVAAEQLRQYHLAEFRTARPLSLVDITGEGLARIGADAALCSGPYEVSQRWALAFWQHPSRPEGILYRARHDPARLCVAAFDRPEVVELMKKGLRPLGGIMSAPLLPLLGSILDLYGIGLA